MVFLTSSYKLRIEAMLLKEEFAATTTYLESSINAILVAGDDLTTSQALQVKSHLLHKNINSFKII